MQRDTAHSYSIMRNVFFKPWIGERFESSGYLGKKLLVLGESHYCEIEQICAECGITGMVGCNDFTNSTVRKFLAYKFSGTAHRRWMNTYTRFGNVMENRRLNADETAALWSSIAFYNYVQIAVTDKRTPPSAENFRISEEAFLRVVRELSPDLIIAWGDRLWGNMPSTGRDVQIQDTRYYVYRFDNGLAVPAVSVYHPSTSHFNFGSHELLVKAIELCHQAAIVL